MPTAASNASAVLIGGLARHRLPGDGVETDAFVGWSCPPLELVNAPRPSSPNRREFLRGMIAAGAMIAVGDAMQPGAFAAGPLEEKTTRETSEGLIEGLTRHRLPGDGVEIDALVGGSGPPLLLLHGFPQTRRAWAKVAPGLSKRFTLVIPDLRGCGRSDKPPGDPGHLAYSRRELAKDQIATMKALGFSRFSVAGHDRGGRLAYRLALDCPEAISRLAVLDVVPTSDAFASVDAASAMKQWHWFFQAQEGELPERMMGADPDAYIRSILASETGPGLVLDPASVEDYVRCFRDPATIHAACEDYRAAWHVDCVLDEQDRGKIKLAMPLLVLWGERGPLAQSRPLDVWRPWAQQAQGRSLPCGHLIPEEASEAVVESFRTFFAS